MRSNTMSKYHQILFLSTTNTCRGYMAEVLMRKELLKRGIKDVEVSSRGTIVLFSEPINPKAVLVMKNNDLPVEEDYLTQPLTEEDVKKSDLILTMTEEQKESLLQEYDYSGDIYTVKELGREKGEVLDPYGKDLIDYEYCCRELDRLIEKIADAIFEEK